MALETLVRVEKAKILSLKMDLAKRNEDQRVLMSELESIEGKLARLSEDHLAKLQQGSRVSLTDSQYYRSQLNEINLIRAELNSKVQDISEDIERMTQELMSVQRQKTSLNNVLKKHKEEQIQSHLSRSYLELDDVVLMKAGPTNGN